MNVRQLLSDKRSQILVATEKARIVQGRIDNTVRQIEVLETKNAKYKVRHNALSRLGRECEIFFQDTHIPLVISFRYCTNSAEVRSDPNGRRSDLQFVSKTDDMLIGRVGILFSKKNKKFYHKENFFIELLPDGRGRESIVLDLDLNVQGFKREDCHDIKIMHSFELPASIMRIVECIKRK